MAEKFYNETMPSFQVIYTCPAGKSALVLSIIVHNTATGSATVGVSLGSLTLLAGYPLAAGETANLTLGKLTLNAGASLTVESDTGGTGDVVKSISVLEMDVA